MTLEDLFDKFLKQRVYEKNVTFKTQLAHKQAWKSFKTHCEHIVNVDQLNKDAILHWLESLHKTSIRATSINCYARSLNAFFKWLIDEGYISDDEVKKNLKIKKLAVPKEVVKTLPDGNLHKLDTFKPSTFGERRIKMLVKTIVDTGIRISEAFNIKLGDVDLCKKLKIEKLGAFHRMRHTFATDFINNGGEAMKLRDILGHEELKTTQIYVHLNTDSLREAHARTSIWGRLERQKDKRK